MLPDSTLASTIARGLYGREPRIESIPCLNNAVFRLRFPDGCKVLKLALSSGGALIRKEKMLLDLLRRHGIPAPVVEYADEDGRRFGSPFLLTNSAGDQTVADCIRRREELCGQLLTEMGVVLARIHNIAFPQADLVSRDLQQDVASLYQRAGELAEKGLLAKDEAARFLSLDVPPLGGAALCHGDFHFVQCIVHQGHISAVVDWESAWAGNAAVDLAIAHAYLDYFHCPFELIRSFFAGYTSVRPLPPEYERAYLPVRMAQALGLLWFWQKQGQPGYVQRAAELYRAYCRYLERPLTP